MANVTSASRRLFSTAASTCPMGFPKNGPAGSVAATASFSTAATLETTTEVSGVKARTTTPKNSGSPRPPPSPALPPGLSGMILGHAGFLQKDPTARQSPFFRLFNMKSKWYRETNSKTILVNMAGNKMVMCSDPTVYREILVEKQSSFTNSNAFREIFGYLFPKSMIVLEGPDWQRVRRVSQKALNRMDMDTVIGSVIEVLDSGAKSGGLKEGENVDTFEFLSHLTFDVFHKVMYSLDPHTITNDPKNPHIQLLEACEGLLSGIRYRLFTRHLKFLWGLPTKKNVELMKNRDFILELGKKIVVKRREALKNEVKDSKSVKSLLDGLILSQEEELLSDQEVNDQIASFFFGAYETTSNTLLFTLNSLADNPEVQHKLRAALLKRFPRGREDIAKATLADLDSVDYLVGTVQESFRLHSTANGIPRDALEDVVVGGYLIKKGTNIHIDHSTVSRDPEFFQGQTDLDEFKPERYEKYPMTDKLLSIPFGFGSRICPGRRIAIAEVKTLVSLMVLEYEILPTTDPSKKLILDSKLGLTCVDGTGFLRFKKL